MNNIIKRKWNQNSMVIIEDLQGMAFQAESGGHTFQISGIDGEGNTVALSGTPAGVMLRADGQDVTLTCSVSGGVVSATLPANAYSVPGRFGLTIFLTSDGQKTAIYAAVGTVGKTSSGTVAPPAGSDVVDLVNAIATAVATIPASYTDLMASVAPTYSSSGLYAVGSYAWYNGKLYRCTTAITSGETWTSGHWTPANLGSDLVDLKSAFDSLFDAIKEAEWESGRLTVGTGASASSSGYTHTIVPVPNDAGMVKVTTAARSPAASIVFYDANHNYLSDYYQPSTADLLHTVNVKVFPGTAYIGISNFEQYCSNPMCRYLPHESDGVIKDSVAPLYDLGNDWLIYKELQGYRLSNAGALIKETGYVCTDFIPAKFGQYLLFDVQPVSPVPGISMIFYNSSKTVIGYDSTRYVKVLPKNTAYIRLSHQSDTLATYKIKLMNAEIRTPYDPIYLMVGSRLSSGGAISNDYVTGYAISWYIDVSKTPYLSIHFEDNSSGRGAYFYDGNFDFISGSATSIYPDHVKYGNLINVPATAKYMILTTGENFNGWTLSAVCSGYRDVYIGTGRKYTSILQALASERGSVRFFIDSGTYNVVNEYKAFYGNDFWDEYEGYSGKIDVQLRGYTPDYGQEMYFSPGAEIVFDYSGDNENVFIQFSVFNLSINNVIDGAKITFGDHIARYAIHDDMANGMGTNRISNCIFNGTSYNGPVIGGGCGLKCDYYVEHCIFENNDGYADVMYHNSLSAGALNHVHVRDCIGNSGVYFYYLGDSQLVSTFIVSNSKFPEIHVEPHPSSSYPHPYVNVRLVEYCNDKTPVS